MEESNKQPENKPCTIHGVSGSGIRTVILVQAITFLFSSVMWWINYDLDKWFTRWALGMLLLSAWGVMKHLSRHYR
jgi:hypothetical protein